MSIDNLSKAELKALLSKIMDLLPLPAVSATEDTPAPSAPETDVETDALVEEVCVNVTKGGKKCTKASTKSFVDENTGTTVHTCNTHFRSVQKARAAAAAEEVAALREDALMEDASSSKKKKGKKVKKDEVVEKSSKKKVKASKKEKEVLPSKERKKGSVGTGKNKAANKEIADAFTEELIKPKITKSAVKLTKVVCNQTYLQESTGDTEEKKLAIVKGEDIMVIKGSTDGKKTYIAIGSITGVSPTKYTSSLKNLVALSDDQLRYAQVHNISVQCLGDPPTASEESSDEESSSDDEESGGDSSDEEESGDSESGDDDGKAEESGSDSEEESSESS